MSGDLTSSEIAFLPLKELVGAGSQKTRFYILLRINCGHDGCREAR